jgi:hypothetical protein
MSHPKKKRPHYCCNHPKIAAVGRCVTCKSWICRDCAGGETGRLYCISRCRPEEPEGLIKKNDHPVVAPSITPSPFPGLMLLAAITLGLCGTVFGLWEIRQYRAIKSETKMLKEKRIELINHIKDANQEIDSLKMELETLRRSAVLTRTLPVKKAAFTAGLSASSANSGLGLPLSFDNGSVNRKVVALTFDGGSLGNVADDILDTLQSRHIVVTVFLTGEFLRAFPDAVKRITAEGHEAGNHTFSHPHLTSWAQDHTHATLPSVTASFICRELARTDSIFVALTGSHFSPIWRTPYGERNRTICIWERLAPGP